MVVAHDGKKVELGKSGRADLIAFPGGFRSWDWNDRNICPCADHRPGISKKAVDYLVDQGCEIVVLSKGFQDVLQTSPDVIDHLKKERKVQVVHENSATCAETYNKLAKSGKKVGLLLHSTC